MLLWSTGQIIWLWVLFIIRLCLNYFRIKSPTIWQQKNNILIMTTVFETLISNQKPPIQFRAKHDIFRGGRRGRSARVRKKGPGVGRKAALKISRRKHGHWKIVSLRWYRLPRKVPQKHSSCPERPLKARPSTACGLWTYGGGGGLEAARRRG